MHHVVTPRFVFGLAMIAFAGCAALVLGNIIGSVVVPGHDWIADTVSDLGAGRYEIIQDVSLYGYAGALIAVAIAASHLHSGTWLWSGMIHALLWLALCVTIIAARNEYGDGDSDGVVIHTYVVYVLGFLFAGLFVERFYCRYLCPLGAALAIPARLRMFDWLKRYKECGNPCQTCANECMVQAIHPTGEINPNECHNCMHCQVLYQSETKCPVVIRQMKRRAAVGKVSDEVLKRGQPPKLVKT